MKQMKMRKGAVMMEYVILAVMIAAAALVAIIYFGRTITRQGETAAYAAAGSSVAAQDTANKAQTTAHKSRTKGEQHNKKFHDLEKTEQ